MLSAVSEPDPEGDLRRKGKKIVRSRTYVERSWKSVRHKEDKERKREGGTEGDTDNRKEERDRVKERENGEREG